MNEKDDWAWPALIHTLQQDISRLHAAVETLRNDHQASRDRYQAEVARLVDQLRAVQQQLEPIVKDRSATQNDRREIGVRWAERAGWGLLLGVGYAIWHYITNHLHAK
jgi:hypothetical protein